MSELTPEMKAIVDAVGAAVREALAPLTQVTERKSITPDIQVGATPFRRRIDPNEVPEKGIRMARAVRSLAACKGDPRAAAYFAEHTIGDTVVAKALSEGTNSAGGYVVPPEFSTELIELLRSTTLVRRAGARQLPMNSNVLNLPMLTGGATSTYIGENSNIVKSEQAFGQLTLTAKKLATLVPISNDLIRDASPAVDAIVRDDLVASMSLREDLAFLRGDGSSNTPTGLLNRIAAGNKFTMTSSPDAAKTIKDLGKLRYLVVKANTRMIRPVWFMSARTEGYLLSLTDANSNRIFATEMNGGKIWGFPYFMSTQVPENLGGGTNESEIYFGDAADMVIGDNESIAIDVSQEAAYHDGSNVVAAFSLDQTVIRVIARHDFALRHTGSFSLLQGVTWV